VMLTKIAHLRAGHHMQGVTVNRPGFRAYLLSWEGWHVHAGQGPGRFGTSESAVLARGIMRRGTRALRQVSPRLSEW